MINEKNRLTSLSYWFPRVKNLLNRFVRWYNKPFDCHDYKGVGRCD